MTSRPSGMKPIQKICKMETKLRVTDSSHWDQLTWRQHTFATHSDTRTIFIRHWQDRKPFKPSVNYPLFSVYGEAVQGYLRELREYYTIDDYSAIITNLRAGAHIPKHTDNGGYFTKSHRIHIPVRTDPATIFTCGDMSLHMELDTAYEIDNVGSPHSVVGGLYDRYHVIIDVWAL